MTDPPVLTGAAIVLRAPKPGDAAERLALGNDPAIMGTFGTDSMGWSSMAEVGAARWFERIASHPHAWVVEHGGQLLGDARLDGLDLHDARARLAIGFYDPAKLGIGLGRDAVRTLMLHAFGTLGLHRLSLRVIAYDTRAIRCYSACGFVVEGREREAALAGGKRYDDVIMGMLAREAHF